MQVGGLSMEFSVSCILDERGGEAKLSSSAIEVEQCFFGVYVYAYFRDTVCEPFGKRRCFAAFVLEGNPPIVCIHIVQAAFLRKGQKHRLHAGVSRLRGDFPFAHFEVAPHDDDLLCVIHCFSCRSCAKTPFPQALCV